MFYHFLLTILGCSSREPCFNGGTCEDGICSCPDDYDPDNRCYSKPGNTINIHFCFFFYLVNIRFLRCIISKCSYWFLFSSNDNKSFHYNNNYYNNNSYNNNYHDYDHNYNDDHYDYIDNNNNSRYRIADELFEYSYFFQFSPYVF